MTLRFEVSDRFVEAADRWAERRAIAREEALATKAEQSLLEIEHLVSGSHDVEFEVDGREIHYEPTEDLSAFLDRWSSETGLEESAVLAMHVDLFANAFLDEVTDGDRQPNVPPGDADKI